MVVPLPAAPLLVVTDLDGTLLDELTYAFEPAREALDALQVRGIPLVLATSKTLAEVGPIAVAIGGDPILIVENGGAVVLPAASSVRPVHQAPRDGDALVVELGVSRESLVRQLAEIADETGTPLRGFSELSVAEIADLSGLSPEAARLAGQRRYDEPFLVGDEDRLPAITAAASRRHLSVSRGGRFYHLTGQTDKGLALGAVLARFAREGRRFVTVGLGDAPNDLPFLRLVNRPILVPRAGGVVDPVLAAALPQAERAPCPGPHGWKVALLTVLAGTRLASVTGAHV